MSIFKKIATMSALSMGFIHSAYASYSDAAHLSSPKTVQNPSSTAPLNIGSQEKPSSIPVMTEMPESFCGRPPLGARKKFSYERRKYSSDTEELSVTDNTTISLTTPPSIAMLEENVVHTPQQEQVIQENWGDDIFDFLQ